MARDKEISHYGTICRSAESGFVVVLACPTTAEAEEDATCNEVFGLLLANMMKLHR